jgi:glutamyl-tRNA reductase
VRISSITFGHPHSSTEERALITPTDDELREGYRRIRSAGVDAFVLATCLRIEVVSLGCEAALDRVVELLFPGARLPTGIRRRDRDVAHHLYRVASGLDSPIVGEPEVLGQFRTAVDTARQAGVIGGGLGRLLDGAVSAGRAARRLLPDTPEGSLALVAADLVNGAREVAVLGAGAMARAATEALRSRNTDQATVTVYARRPDDVRFPSDHVRHIDRAPEALASAPAVISATAAKRELFAPDVLERALRRRADELLLIDLAMPPDFHPAADMPMLTYVNLDDLAERARRDQVAADLDAFVAGSADKDWDRLGNRRTAGPVIAAILSEAEATVNEEVERFATRIQSANGNAEALIRQLAETVAHRVLHRPLSYLGAGAHGPEAAELLAEIFGVDRA